MIEILPYTLPDFRIIEEQWEDYRFFVWQPAGIFLILGTGNKPEKSLIIKNVLSDKIPVYKRPSGGETVILSPKMLVISTLIHDENFSNPKIYFQTANDKIINTLKGFGVNDLRQKGISDIAIEEKKILGSSIYRKSNKVFYHAVMNVAEDTEIIEKYIRHPQKEPDYRQGRSHSDFVTSLHKEGYIISIVELKQKLIQNHVWNGL